MASIGFKGLLFTVAFVVFTTFKGLAAYTTLSPLMPAALVLDKLVLGEAACGFSGLPREDAMRERDAQIFFNAFMAFFTFTLLLAFSIALLTFTAFRGLGGVPDHSAHDLNELVLGEVACGLSSLQHGLNGVGWFLTSVSWVRPLVFAADTNRCTCT